jgi:Protein of unknown function (DUF4240)
MRRPVSWLRACCYYPPVVPGQGEFKIPAPADEARLWALVEAAWAPLGPEVRQARGELVVRRSGSQADISVVAAALPTFLGILTGHCRGLPADELTTLDRVVERKLWELDRADVHAVTGGSDDGFLYSRGFVVAMGREFCDAVTGDPEMAVPYAECEEMCYFFADLYRERFGEFPETGSGISRESCSNAAGWAS